MGNVQFGGSVRAIKWIVVVLISTCSTAMADVEETEEERGDLIDSDPESVDEEESAEWDISESYGETHSVDLDLTEGTWMSVSVSGDTIVFDLLGDIWSLPISGGEASRLTSGPAWDSEPRFSPNGDQIAFVSDADGNEQIWLMNADGSEAEKFTDEDNARTRCT